VEKDVYILSSATYNAVIGRLCELGMWRIGSIQEESEGEMEDTDLGDWEISKINIERSLP
jgi:hypothetical protein